MIINEYSNLALSFIFTKRLLFAKMLHLCYTRNEIKYYLCKERKAKEYQIFMVWQKMMQG